MNNKQSNHDNKHQRSIENIQNSLMLRDKPIIPLCVLKDPENISHQNTHAREVYTAHIPSPPESRIVGYFRRVPVEADMKVPRDEYEETEHHNLEYQPRNNNLPPRLHNLGVSSGLKACACKLAAEAEYVAKDEDLRDPPRADQRES